jgi:hypothetical protein
LAIGIARHYKAIEHADVDRQMLPGDASAPTRAEIDAHIDGRTAPLMRAKVSPESALFRGRNNRRSRVHLRPAPLTGRAK